jgi:malate synthase
MGGMSAFIPSRKDESINEKAFESVANDKKREAGDGFDGSWVAHPDSVPVAMEQFDAVLGERPNQLDRLREDVEVSGEQLVDFEVPGGEITQAGLHVNVSVGTRYIDAWPNGVGAAALDNLMEDAATAEISRSQVWQWIRLGVELQGDGELSGQTITKDLVTRLADEEVDKLGGDAGAWSDAKSLFLEMALADDFPEFLTLPAYERLA